uniref:Mariner transposase [Bombyx mori] n=1 Tax=Lepeophtheirus salmonis TaxID=72036 RepID=A0A0K2U7I8_LEPSM
MGPPPYIPALASNAFFLFRTSRKNACSTIFVARRCC